MHSLWGKLMGGVEERISPVEGIYVDEAVGGAPSSVGKGSSSEVDRLLAATSCGTFGGLLGFCSDIKPSY